MTTRTRISWSAEDDAEIRRIYAISSHGLAAAALKKFAMRKGVRTRECRRRARMLGIVRVRRNHRPWSEVEDENIRQYAGRLPVWRIAKILGRSEESVICRMHLLEQSARVKDRGYTREELAQLMGIDRGDTLRLLLQRWPIKVNSLGNFAPCEVQMWVFDHLEHLELRKFDQTFLKAMIRECAA